MTWEAIPVKMVVYVLIMFISIPAIAEVAILVLIAVKKVPIIIVMQYNVSF